MVWLWIILFGLLLSFSFVLMFGAPYLPTMRRQQDLALKLLDLKPGQKLYDLGSGDGRLLVAAAKKGIRATGYELNPLLVIISRWRLRRYSGLAEVKFADFWRADISDADGVYVFLIGSKMAKLDKFLTNNSRHKTVKLASYGFAITGKKPVAIKKGVYLYSYGSLARRL